MGVKYCGELKLTNNRRNDPRIDAHPPCCRVDSYSVGREPARQLTLSGGNDDLRSAPPSQLTSEKPDLPLTPTPLPSGSNVNDRRVHAPGKTSAGSAPRSCVMPLSRTTSASRLRSSDRLNGLCK
jgi:hypothetical protein